MSENFIRFVGWVLFDFYFEYVRMGLFNSAWCCSFLNKDYQVGLIFKIDLNKFGDLDYREQDFFLNIMVFFYFKF